MGSSRPNLLKYTYESFKRFVLYDNTNLKSMMHEDYLYPDESEKSLKYADNNFDTVILSKPKIGVGYAMDKMFKDVTAPYIFYLQDDWEFERPVDLDRIIWTMEKHKKINCITFNKFRNMNGSLEDAGFENREYDYDGMKLCIYPGWQFLPGVWRMSKVREKWSPRKIRPEGNFQNSFGSDKERTENKDNFLENTVGAYMYGAMGEYRHVRHIGGTWRMADWQIKANNYKPTGVRHWDFKNLERDRGPWLGDLPARPLNSGVPLNKEGRELIEKQPKYIQEMYK